MLKIVVLVGLPGSGKSTHAARMGWPALSSDHLRQLLADDPADQRVHSSVFAVLRYLLRRRLELRRPLTCLDATHLTPRERRPYFKIAKKYGAEIEAVFFDVPVDLCQQRNRQRRRVVPTAVIELMASKLIRPTVAEGFARVSLVKG